MDEVVQTTAKAAETGDLRVLVYLIGAFGAVWFVRAAIDLWKEGRKRDNEDARVLPKLGELLGQQTQALQQIIEQSAERHALIMKTLETQHAAIMHSIEKQAAHLDSHQEIELKVFELGMNSAIQSLKESKTANDRVLELERAWEKRMKGTG